MASNLNFNPFNAITVSLELTPLVQFKVISPMPLKSILILSMPLEIGSIYLGFKNSRIKNMD
jgi:hypothetical protein